MGEVAGSSAPATFVLVHGAGAGGYLDAFAPRDGESAFDCRPDLAPTFRSLARDGLRPPIDPDFAGVETEEQAQLLRERLTTLPIGLMEEKVVLRNAAAAKLPPTYIWCTRSGFGEDAARARSAGWDYRELDAKHMVMLTAPEALAGLLLELAAI